MTNYQLQTEKTTEPYAPHIDADCGRVSVVLGSNGAGKTQLLSRIVHRLHSKTNRRYLNVEGSRIVTNSLATVGIDSNSYVQYSHPARAELDYAGKRTGELTHRIRYSLMMLKQRSAQEREEYLESVVAWDDAGGAVQKPKKPVYTIDRVFSVFSGIFPAIRIFLNEHEQVFLEQYGRTYPITSGSEGERQVFALLADLLLNTKDDDFLVLVDEPEAHLNPLLACRVWDAIEAYLDKVQFVHTTHCVAFAMREGVDSLFVINKTNATVEPISGIDSIPSYEMREFLGAIPSILSTKYAIGVEGEQNSFDFAFYRWLLNRNDVSIVPIGSRQEVIGETSRLALWSQLAPSATIIGVVDRDFKDPVVITEAESTGVVVLDYHEAESYLCEPEVLSTTVFKTFGQKLDSKAITARIVEFAGAQLWKIVSRRVAAMNSVTVTPSVTRSQLDSIGDAALLCSAILAAFTRSRESLDSAMTSERISIMVNNEYSTLQTAIEANDIATLLRLVPGKELLHTLVRMTGFQSVDALLKAITHQLDASEFASLNELRVRLNDKLGGHVMQSNAA